MHHNDPLARFMALPGVADAAQQAVDSIARAHRRPAGLRRPEVISAESLLRGARVTAPDMRVKAGPETSAFSLLAPELLTTTVRSFSRAPLGVLARADVAAGGPGVPVQAQSLRAQALARFITAPSGPSFDQLAPAIVHAEIAAWGMFGPRSQVVARVASRAMAVHTGLDPRCFAVPETYLNRHAGNYAAALESYRAGQPGPVLLVLLAAWEAGGKEADAIARAA